MLITLTPLRTPVVAADWIWSGTHIAAMGADTVGKQELEMEIVSRARLLGDVPDQAVPLGECQHAFGLVRSTPATSPLWYISCRGAVTGRRDAYDITIVDSTGMAQQDLAAAAVAIAAAERTGRTQLLDCYTARLCMLSAGNNRTEIVRIDIAARYHHRDVPASNGDFAA